MSPDRLIYMANQIGRFFAHCPPDVAAIDIANHLRKFWDPRMRLQIIAKLDQPDAAFEPTVRRAVESLRQTTGNVAS
jgi:formate dehydrogenase subunit delta